MKHIVETALTRTVGSENRTPPKRTTLAALNLNAARRLVRAPELMLRGCDFLSQPCSSERSPVSGFLTEPYVLKICPTFFHRR